MRPWLSPVPTPRGIIFTSTFSTSFSKLVAFMEATNTPRLCDKKSQEERATSILENDCWILLPTERGHGRIYKTQDKRWKWWICCFLFSWLGLSNFCRPIFWTYISKPKIIILRSKIAISSRHFRHKFLLQEISKQWCC